MDPLQRNRGISTASGADSTGPTIIPGATTTLTVHIKSHVMLRIQKHWYMESSSGDDVKGTLLGFRSADDPHVVEITHSFPMPKSFFDERNSGQDEADKYQAEMLSLMEKQNYDNFSVGWYRSSSFGPHIDFRFFESQLRHQRRVEEYVVLVYDPIRAIQGLMNMKAFRVNDRILQMSAEKGFEFGITDIKRYGVSFSDIMQEVPLVITSSNLTCALLCELEMLAPTQNYCPFLSLDQEKLMEKHLNQVTDCVERLGQENIRLQGLHEQVKKFSQHRQRQIERKNTERAERNMPPMTPDEINEIFPPPHDPNRHRHVVLSSQAQMNINRVKQFSSQNLTKLNLIDAMQNRYEEASSTFLAELNRSIAQTSEILE